MMEDVTHSTTTLTLNQQLLTLAFQLLSEQVTNQRKSAVLTSGLQAK